MLGEKNVFSLADKYYSQYSSPTYLEVFRGYSVLIAKIFKSEELPSQKNYTLQN
jgi:hypothetical protein